LWVYLLGRFSLMLYFFPAAYPNIYYRTFFLAGVAEND